MSGKSKTFFSSSIFCIFIYILCYNVFNAALCLGAKDTAGEPAGSTTQPALQFNYDSKGRRDPLMSLVTPDGRIIETEDIDEKNAAIRLQGIVYDPRGGSYAVINGTVVKKGEQIGDYQVVDIQPQKIILMNDNEETEVELRREE